MDWQHHLFWLPGLINFIALITRVKYGGIHFSFYLPCSLLFEGIFTRSWIGHVRVPKTLTFKMKPSAQPFCENEFCLRENEKIISLSGKDWALNLVLIQRPGGTRKWLIVQFRRLGRLIEDWRMCQISRCRLFPFLILVACSVTLLCIKFVRSADQWVFVSPPWRTCWKLKQILTSQIILVALLCLGPSPTLTVSPLCSSPWTKQQTRTAVE